jgi:5-methylcytosine-specific restriction endonuclease McrA
VNPPTAAELAEDQAALDADPGWEQQTVPPMLDALLSIEAIYTRTSAERLAELRAMDYRTEYLKSPEWRRTRLSTLCAVGHRCQACGAYDRHLDVHHLSYARLGEEQPADLAALCRRCHVRQHEREAAG